MIKIIETTLTHDLKPLSVYWWKRGFAHRIVEEAGQQVVMLEQVQHRDAMLADFEAYSKGELAIQLRPQTRLWDNSGLRQIIQSPVTVLMILASIAGFVIVSLDWQAAIDWLVIQSLDHSAIARQLNLPEQISVNEFLAHGQYWRMVTPIFLHFGWLHITFNMLWLWELGRRIERHCGSLHLLFIILFIGIASNLYQAASTPFAFFGGMSGVIYGLLGYSAVFNFISPHRNLVQPKAVYVLMLVSLAVGWLGVFDFLARMANTAHLSGLIFGALIGLPAALMTRYMDASGASSRKAKLRISDKES